MSNRVLKSIVFEYKNVINKKLAISIRKSIAFKYKDAIDEKFVISIRNANATKTKITLEETSEYNGYGFGRYIDIVIRGANDEKFLKDFKLIFEYEDGMHEICLYDKLQELILHGDKTRDKLYIDKNTGKWIMTDCYTLYHINDEMDVNNIVMESFCYGNDAACEIDNLITYRIEIVEGLFEEQIEMEDLQEWELYRT